MAAPRKPAPPGARPRGEAPAAEDTTLMPDGEDATRNTPVNVSGARVLPRAPEAFDADAEDEVEIFVSGPARGRTSGAYASLLAEGEQGQPLFSGLPPPEEAVPALFEPLPEMSAEIWQAGVRALVTVPESIDPPWPDDEYWRDLARVYLDELGLAESAADQVHLTMAAARVAERLGDASTALQLIDDALAVAPDAPEAWRARARLLEAASNGQASPEGAHEAAHEAWRRVGQRAARAGGSDAGLEEERTFYRALDAEWTLARAGQLDGPRMEGATLSGLPEGPARALAAAELALLRGTPADVASALEQAAFGAGGALGATLMESAARFHELAGDPAAAAEQRFVAARMDAGAATAPLGRLRDAARQEPEQAEASLMAVHAALPPSALADAVSRWAASLARRRGDVAPARERLASGGAASPAAALTRERLDLAVDLAAPLDAETVAQARAGGASHGGPDAALVMREAAGLARAGDAPGALARLAQALEVSPDAVPLGLMAEDLALADALDDRGGEGVELGVRAALQTAIEAAPGGSAFWTAAALDARAGRLTDAAAALAFGAELWARSRLAGPLVERAAELASISGASDALAGIAALAEEAAPEAERLWTVARAVARAGGPPELQAWLTEQARADGGIGVDAHTKAGWWIRRAEWSPASSEDQRLACLEAALAVVPGHPVALALLMREPAAPPARVGAAQAAAGAATDNLALQLQAIHGAALAGDEQTARELAEGLHAANPTSTAAAELLQRLVRADDGPRAAAELAARAAPAPSASAGGAFQALRAAEALEAIGETARALELVRALDAAGPTSAEAARAVARLSGATAGGGLPAGGFPSPHDGEAEDAARALARLRAAAEHGRWSEAVTALERDPPHQPPGGAGTLYLAGLLEEGRGDAARAAQLFSAAAAQGVVSGLAGAARAAEPEAPGGRPAHARALELAAALVGPDSGDPQRVDARSAAALLHRAAAARLAAGDEAGAERRLREALAADAEHLPSALALRRAAARRRDLAATVEACAEEADLLRDPAARVQALLRGAELARRAPAGGAAAARHEPALTLFRRALETEPASEPAFAGLRALLEERGDHEGVAAALAARIAVARNPFEVTALRSARAELLAGALVDREGAKGELELILQKEPQHPRALARLSDLQYDDGAFSAAGELYLRRALVEPSPAVLREILLRLGRIYTRHVPDAKRAIGAYARVLQSEPDNHEALSALSDLYLETGESKNALAVTETLTAVERDPARRLATLIRAGQLWEKTGDPRPAGARFRQAVDEAPRDVGAVTELARFLERTRDPAGRRALLDHAVGLLRHDVERGRFELATLTALVPLLQARGKPQAAAAAAQLCAAISDDPVHRDAVAGWAAPPPRGRRLGALSKPEFDERTFPPALLPGMRHVFRLVGPLLAKGRPDLARHGVDRVDRVARGQPARDAVDAVAVELVAVPDVDVYVRSSTAGAPPAAVRVEPGDRPAVILGAPILSLGSRALRFAAARALRLVATHLDLVLAATPADAGALLGGVIRQFVPEFRHPEVRDQVLELETERVGRLLTRKLKQEVMPFAIESAGAFDLAAVYAAVRDGANAVGLLACGELPAALSVVLAGVGQGLTLADIARSPEALSLLRFALSDDYDELAQAME